MFNRTDKTGKKNQKNKGFSLVELIVVIAIMAVLVAVLAPQFTKYVDKSRQSNDAATVSGIVTAAQVAIADTTNGVKPDTYTIKVTKTEKGTTITGTDAGEADASTLKKAIEASCGDLKKMKATASAWDEIDITLVYKDGAVTITYNTSAFDDYVNGTTSED